MSANQIEAVRAKLDAWLKQCPAAEGWTLHRAAAEAVDEGLIMELALDYSRAILGEGEVKEYAM